MQPLEQKALTLLKQNKRPLNRRTIAEHLGLKGQERKQLTRTLEHLASKGQIEERKGFYRLSPPKKRVTGTFSLAERGFGFLRPDIPEQEDLFIPAREVGTAMDGDQIEVSCHFSPRQGRPFARVHRILKRAHSRLLGHYQSRRGKTEVWPLQRSLGGPFLVHPNKSIRNGDVVNIRIEHYADGRRPARGQIIENLGTADNPQVDIDIIIRDRGLPHQFSIEALDEADRIARNIDKKDLENRTDLRNLPLVTIDGESARDFDDAVALRKEADGHFRLWVCIADVAHYVQPFSPLEQDALERGTSVYFPGFCLPMLPESLSNGLCSLKPHQDRLVMAAELLIDTQGQTISSDFYPAVMNSHARLTYTQVAHCLDKPDSSDLDPKLQKQLAEMAELATILTAMRHQRGSLDLDLPEVEIILDDSGQPIDLKRIDRHQAHRLIEEFMLAANEAVACFLAQSGRPFLYRIHEPPDIFKLQDLQQLAAQCGIGMVLGKDLHHALQELLKAVADKPEARMIHQHLLRSLQQACYSAENRGHFGLASDHYCHFTSPIRRYPDLAVHRVLKQALKQEKGSLPSGKKLLRLGQDCSDKERRAMQAERELIALRSCQFMAGRTGDRFQGTIASVTDFGFFVELDDIFVDGLVHIRTLNDYFHFDPSSMSLTGERQRQKFQVGMRVTVQVKQVELWRRRIDFTLIEVHE